MADMAVHLIQQTYIDSLLYPMDAEEVPEVTGGSLMQGWIP